MHALLPPGLTYDLGWTLIHFLWEGLVLAAILQMILPMCQGAAQRHNWALAILAMMLMAPVATFFFIHGREETGVSLVMVAGAGFSHLGGNSVTILQAPIPFGWIDGLVAFWLAGITLLSLRALGGWYLVEMLWRRDAFAVPADLAQRCKVLQNRLALTRPIVFLQSCRVNAPVVIGWFRPIILIPVSAVTGLLPHQLDALIMHELAHIRRLDTFTNILLVLAETILFYHPAVWWVSRRVRLEREHCCDDFAVAMCGDAAMYVEALTSLKSSKGLPVLVLAASGGKLKDRVARLLDVPCRSRKISPFAVMGLLLLCAVATTAATARSGKDDVAAPRTHALARIAWPMTVPKADDFSVAPAQTDGGYRRQAAVRKPQANEISPPVPAPPDDAAQATVLAMAQDSHERNVSAPSPDQQADVGAPVNLGEPGPALTDSNIERIVVTARKWLGNDPVAAIHDFVNSYTNPATLTVGEIARWRGAICARTYGLAKPEDEDFVTTRVEDIARDTGLKVKSGPCHLSIEIIFTPQPQDFLNRVRARNASLLGPKPSQADTRMRYPVQAWYATTTRDVFGGLMLDDEDDDNAAFTDDGKQGLSMLATIPTRNVEGFRWRTGLNSELAHIYVIADTRKIEGQPLAPVADYVAVLALSQTQNFDDCKPMPSITNLVSPVCGNDLKTAAITDSDLAYLKAVYTMDPGANLQQQRSYIADRIALALGVK